MNCRLAALLSLYVFLLGAPAMAGEDFPYTAYVDFDNTPVRSGAGDAFHPTSLLHRGDAVQVWRHDAGGWRAIRPLSNSFSWVDARYVSRQPDSAIGQMKAGGVSAWIGSATGGTRSFHSQVKLKAGEKVEILGERKAIAADGSGETVWLKIAPPAGEFRFINGIFLRRTPPQPISPPVAQQDTVPSIIQDAAVQQAGLLMPIATQPAEATTTPSATAPAANTAPPTSPAPAATLPAAKPLVVNTPPPATVEGAFRELGSTIQTPAATTPAVVSVPATTPAPAASTAKSTLATPIAPLKTPPAATTTALATLPADSPEPMPVTQQATPVDTSLLPGSDIGSLEVNLSLMAAQDQKYWQFEDLKAKTQAIVENGATALERGRARVLLERIEAFDSLRRRALIASPPAPAATAATTAAPIGPQLFSQAPVGVGVAPVSVATPVAGAVTPPLPGGVAQAAYTPRVNIAPGVDGAPGAQTPGFMGGIDPRFDGSGRLVQVVVQQDHMPQFALTDAAGRVLQYITPAPGFNLHRYVGQEIGVYGQRGFIPHLRSAHVTAQRVVVLSRHR